MNNVLKFEDTGRWYGRVRELVQLDVAGQWSCDVNPYVNPTEIKVQQELLFSMYYYKISARWTKLVHFVSKKYRKTYFVASSGRDLIEIPKIT